MNANPRTDFTILSSSSDQVVQEPTFKRGAVPSYTSFREIRQIPTQQKITLYSDPNMVNDSKDYEYSVQQFPLYILIIILVIIGLVWVYFRFDSGPDEYELIRRQTVNETVQWLYKSVNDVCYNCNMSPIYEFKETSQITYTDKVTSEHNVKGTIYIVIWDEAHSRVFNHNTLIYSALHEIAHILSPSIHHEPPFDSIESILLNKAIDLGYYDPNIAIESHYMTLDLNGPL